MSGGRDSFLTSNSFPDDSSDDSEVDGVIVDRATDIDIYQPHQVQERVRLVVQSWGSVAAAISPDKFLYRLLTSRGYSAVATPALQSEYKRSPTPKQLKDYDNELLNAIRQSDLEKIKALRANGRSLTACNRFGESAVHMACRRSEFDVVEYVLGNIEGWVVDDYGRTPLHDACWRPEPRFDVVTAILDINLNLLILTDVRGAIPLNYVREEHWIQWCAYLFHQKDKYWKVQT